jgi:hypothetical protein
VQGIALSALKGVQDINTYLETFVAPDLEGISEAGFRYYLVVSC